MPVIALTSRLLCLALLSVPGAAFAADAALSLEEAKAAFRLVIDAEIHKHASKPSLSLLVATMLESMKIAAVQGCQPVDEVQTTCILKIEGSIGDDYTALRFRRDGTQWRVVEEKDIDAPQPTLARAQDLVRGHLSDLASQEQDPKTAAQYKEFATSLTVTALESCRLERDSDAVECHADLDTPSQGKGSKPLRFRLQGTNWSLLPD
ncbi:hypothetical protein [Lysobacter antibioticus]|uniref:hypothetical protein n=1 Tax=Lysobacter antibioticus TaxID=84531 RepID=UPI0007166635|nr:hypothetical protein [Lysobacter antibioticus]